MYTNSKISQIFFLSALLIFIGCSQTVKELTTVLSGRTMGTSYSIKIVDENLASNETDQKKLHAKIDSILVEVNNQMSTWQKDSEISEFNSSQSKEWFKVSKDFAEVVKDANKISKVSGGAFDITVGPLVELWGFGPSIKDEDELPNNSDIEKAKQLCDYKKISIDSENFAIKKEEENIKIDLSSIAKGFGVDKIANYFKASGYNNFLVEIGGEVRTSGHNHLNEVWKIGISVPDGSFDIQKIIGVKNLAVATSGDYRNYFERNGVRYSHTIDPRTGKPITHNLASVTVVYDNCTLADGYATAIDVLGPEDGYKLALKEKLPVFLIVKTDKGFKEKMTPEFEKLLKNQK